MQEDKKIGFLALVVGAISLGEAWVNILAGQTNLLEVFFLGLGLVACLVGIALILHKVDPQVKE